MRNLNATDRSDTGARRRPTRGKTVLSIVVVIILGALIWVAFAWQNSSEPPREPASQPATPEPICRAEGEFVAGFMSPQTDDDRTAAIVGRMNTDAVTFGGRLEPTDAQEYPDEVAEAIGDRQAYQYTVPMNWQGVELADTDRTLNVGDTEYGLIQTSDDAVVVTESVNGADAFHSLTRVATEHNYGALIGLPIPQMRTSGETWLPDNSYADVVDAFAEKFVTAYHERGADGFYLALEMPLTDADHWDPVTDYYSRQTRIINDVAPGATVLISPYLEGRKDRATITPDTAAAGYQKLLELHNGTRVLVSPQDGVGVGTTALEADESAAHQYTVEDYFTALHETNPQRLYVTIEAMQPGGGSSDTREPTTRDRVEAQLDATDPYVQGAIGFQWADPNSMAHIPHIGDGACAAGAGRLD